MDVDTVEPGPPVPRPSEHVHVGPDGFTYADAAPYALAHRYLDGYLAACLAETDDRWRARMAGKLGRHAAHLGITHSVPRVEILCAAMERFGWALASGRATQDHGWSHLGFTLSREIGDQCDDLSRADATLSPDQLDHILRLLVASDWLMGNCWYNVLPIVERAVRKHPLTPERRTLVWQYIDSIILTGLDYGIEDKDARVLERLDEMTGHVQVGLRVGEPWTDAALADIVAMPEAARAAWENLLQHALTATASRPTKTWLRGAATRVDPIGWPAIEEHIMPWFEAATQPARLPMHDRNATILKGLIWCCALRDSDDAPQLAQAVGRLGEAMFRKVGFYARCLKAGNACLYTLSMMPGMESIAQLARLRLRVKGRGAQEAVHKALAAAAERAGLPRDEVEEMVVPTFGLDHSGQLRQEIGAYSAEITVRGTQQVQWRWLAPDGTAQKDVPAPVKMEHAAELKALKGTADEMQKMLAGQRDRLEGLFLRDRSWPLTAWRERYLDHPLLAQMCRRLIWQVTDDDRTAPAAWRDGQLVDVADHPLDWLTDATIVRLWHPIGCPPELVLRWRLWLEEHGVTQPFKQAHREEYVLTDAELATGTYSNRFAAHILRQHQLYALCQQRGWRYRVQGPFDSGGDLGASRLLPRWGLRAEFWVDAVEGRDDEHLESGLFRYVSTDWVRFCATDGTLRPLSEVPALVFSEVMRDIDLFVSVCSIGNDPTWTDRGEGGYADYWRGYAFGDLSTSATTRREVLTRLVPRLRIADRCRVAGRFLVVRGDLRTYKVHLGSGNVLMEPNDEYLCIVPDRRRVLEDGGQVFLPFEGDATLALIVSKAFLLANDARISDPTIARQIRHA